MDIKRLICCLFALALAFFPSLCLLGGLLSVALLFCFMAMYFTYAFVSGPLVPALRGFAAWMKRAATYDDDWDFYDSE